MDEGWTRWLFERYGFDVASVRNADIRAGQIGDRYDVIILADYGSGTILNGYAQGTVPGDYVGGIGPEGAGALEEFVRGGGTLVCLNGSSRFAMEAFDLPVRDVTAGVPGDEFSMSGSLIEVITDPTHPVMAGMPQRSSVFFSRSPVFTTTEGFEGVALAKHVDSGSPLLSGYLLGEEHLHGYAAALDVHHGRGHVILLGFKPQWRGQPFGSFRAMFNAALFHGSHAQGAGGQEGFWRAPVEEGTEGAG
jgi:ribosomal protein S18 acetylase RimI-like enzyme